MKRKLTKINPSPDYYFNLALTNAKKLDKEELLPLLAQLENQLNEMKMIPEYITLSLLRRQYYRGDIDKATLFYWLKNEGLTRR